MSNDKSVILITGATDKVGQNLIRVISSNKNWGDSRLNVLCHNMKIDENKRINVVKWPRRIQIQEHPQFQVTAC